jgi:hypothetical protein
MTYQLYIELEQSDPLVWRRIMVPASLTFYQLHLAIQGAFGWENAHLFQFSENGLEDPIGYGLVLEGIEEDFVTMDARKTKMRKVFRKEKQDYCYVYDFGDYWKHHIQLEKIIDEELFRPQLMDGAGACPPEDVGGPHGYGEMIKALNTPGHPERKDYMEWLDLKKGEKWDPAFFSFREVNKRLALLG